VKIGMKAMAMTRSEKSGTDQNQLPLAGQNDSPQGAFAGFLQSLGQHCVEVLRRGTVGAPPGQP
jgi:hypothetical protein